MSDKHLTAGKKPNQRTESPKGPHSIVKHGSVTVPIYEGITGGKIRYTLAYYHNGRRRRRMFTDLDKAKREAKLIAEKIQRGLAANNDLSSRERDLFHAAKSRLPVVALRPISWSGPQGRDPSALSLQGIRDTLGVEHIK